MRWHRTEIAGKCFGCDCDGEEFYSVNTSDSGPWMCLNCKEVIDRFLHLGGYIISIAIPY